MEKDIFSKQNVGLIIVGDDERIIDYTRYIESIMKKEIRNSNIIDVLDSNSYMKYHANIVNLKKGQWKHCRLNFIDRENETIMNECIIQKTEKSGGAYSLLVFPVMDNTYKPEISTEQNVMDYSQNIFHDLRSYLFTISTKTRTLRELLDGEDALEILEIIVSNLEGLSFLIENLGAYAQIADGKFLFEKCDLLELISESGKTIISTIQELKIEKINFEIKIDEKIVYQSTEAGDIGKINFRNGKKFIIYCDKNFFKRVLINLLSNAIKYSRTKHPPEISIKISRGGGNDIIHIRDNGIGIRKAEKNKIFQRGYRANRELVKKSRGSGIGLDISRKILLKHNGKIELFDTKTDEYSDFIILLPSKR